MLILSVQRVESYEVSYFKKYQNHVPCSFACKLVCFYDKFNKPIVVFRGKKAAYKFIESVLKEYEYCKKVTKNTLTKI